MNSTYPQDNEGGMLVVKMKDNNVTWEADSSLHLECMEGTFVFRQAVQQYKTKMTTIRIEIYME